MDRAGTGHVSAAAMRVGEGAVCWASAPSPQPCPPSRLAPLAAAIFRPEGLTWVASLVYVAVASWLRAPGSYRRGRGVNGLGRELPSTVNG